MPKSLKQLTTHCSISSPSTSSALTVDSSTPGFAGQHTSILVLPLPRFSTSNLVEFLTIISLLLLLNESFKVLRRFMSSGVASISSWRTLIRSVSSFT
uniref:Uncharacterized protein n=1 Tax=Arundo donax TaxID=35708 RepID=A0A0A9FEE6_ARUDO